MAQLVCENLTIGYETGPVLSGLDLAVEPGEYLCIVGENGAGKSTLMRTLLGLLKPLDGTVRLQTDAAGGHAEDPAIGYLPQQTDLQKDFPASVREVVLSGCRKGKRWRPFYSTAEKKLAAANMERAGIADLATRCYRELSGGQQQRVLLARALCAATDMLLLDEPVTGLDPQAAKDMYALIDRLHKEGMTILMISHDVETALPYADHVLYLEKGGWRYV